MPGAKPSCPSPAIPPSMRAVALISLALLLLVLVPAPPAAATTVADGVDPFATAWATQRKLVVDDAGDWYAVLVARNATGGREVMVLRSGDGGASWDALPPPSTSDEATIRPSLAPAPGGGVWLAWTELVPEAGHYEVFAARWTGEIPEDVGGGGGGEGLWLEPARLSFSTGYSGFPDVDVDSRGRVHVAWYGLEDRDAGYRILYRQRAPGGGWGDVERLTVGFPDAVNPTLAVDDEDRVHLAWYKQENTLYRVYYARRGADGWSAPRDLSGELSHARNPSLAVLRSNDVLVAWNQEDEAGAMRVRVATVGGEGDHVVAGSPRFVSPEHGDARHPSVTVSRGGAILAAWMTPEGVTVARVPVGTGNATIWGEVRGEEARHPSLQGDPPGDAPAAMLYTARSGEDAWEARLARVLPGTVTPWTPQDPPFLHVPFLIAVASLAAAIALILAYVRRR